jgi:hypothetical protein
VSQGVGIVQQSPIRQVSWAMVGSGPDHDEEECLTPRARHYLTELCPDQHEPGGDRTPTQSLPQTPILV